MRAKDYALSNLTQSLKTPQNVAELNELYKRNDLVYYSPVEELFNVLTHSIGIAYGLIMLVLMLLRATTPESYATAVLASTSITIMFICSSVYHGVNNLKAKRTMRRIDYSSVNLTVIACGTAPCLLYGITYGYVAYGVTCLIALIITFLCMRFFGKFRYVAIASNFLNGALLSISYILARNNIASLASALYIAGLILCLIGAILFGIKRRFIHTAFHIFVLVGPALCIASNYIQIS